MGEGLIGVIAEASKRKNTTIECQKACLELGSPYFASPDETAHDAN